MQAGEQGM